MLDADADADRLFRPEPEEAKEMLIVGVVGCFPTLGREPRERRLLEPLCRLGGAMESSISTRPEMAAVRDNWHLPGLVVFTCKLVLLSGLFPRLPLGPGLFVSRFPFGLGMRVGVGEGEVGGEYAEDDMVHFNRLPERK